MLNVLRGIPPPQFRQTCTVTTRTPLPPLHYFIPPARCEPTCCGCPRWVIVAVFARDGPLIVAVVARDGPLIVAVVARDGPLIVAVVARDGPLIVAMVARDGSW